MTTPDKGDKILLGAGFILPAHPPRLFPLRYLRSHSHKDLVNSTYGVITWLCHSEPLTEFTI